MKKIYSASYLAIDQYNGSGIDDLRELKNYGIKWLPTSIIDINFTANSNHRTHTHRGWDTVYNPDKGHWDIRKMILLSTVNNVFNFGSKTNNPERYEGQCNSFAALIYYVHLLGDTENSDDLNEALIMLPLGGRKDDIGIIHELLQHIEILFPKQHADPDYKELVNELKNIDSKLKPLVQQKGGLQKDDKESRDKYRSYATETLSVLEHYLYKLLKNEPFFKKVFY